MIFGQSRLEMKVGVFVFIGLLILGSFVLMIGKYKTWVSGYKFDIIFNFVNGVKLGAPVRFAGVDVGEVKQVKVFFSPEESQSKVKIVTWVRNDVRIPGDSAAWVNTLGLLGEKYIEIMPGKDYTQLIERKGTMAGNDPLAMQEMGAMAKKLVDDLDETVVKIRSKEGTIGRLLSEDTIYKELEAAIKNRQGTIGRFIYDDSVYREVEALVTDLKKHPWKLLSRPKGDR